MSLHKRTRLIFSTLRSLPVFSNTNTRSIINRIDELAILLKEHGIDVAAKTETWLKTSIPESIISVEGYNVIRRDRVDKIGGGVALYIRDGQNVSVMSMKHCGLQSDLLECLVAAPIYVLG